MSGTLKSLVVLVGLIIGMCVHCCAAEEPRLDLVLSFSSDDGKTYSRTPQMPADPRFIKLRVSWDNPRPADELEPYTSTLSCAQSDFASALTGKQSWNGTAWFQRPSPAYLMAGTAQQFDYTLDLGARPEGVTGYQNKWDSSANKQIDAPLPACPALSPGTYKFTIRVSYWLRKVTPNRRVDGQIEFTLNVAQPAEGGPATKPSATISIQPTMLARTAD